MVTDKWHCVDNISIYQFVQHVAGNLGTYLDSVFLGVGALLHPGLPTRRCQDICTHPVGSRYQARGTVKSPLQENPLKVGPTFHTKCNKQYLIETLSWETKFKIESKVTLSYIYIIMHKRTNQFFSENLMNKQTNQLTTVNILRRSALPKSLNSFQFSLGLLMTSFFSEAYTCSFLLHYVP